MKPKFVGINDSGDFDQQALAGMKSAWLSGDDQYSLEGVDFGEDYMQDYGVTPVNLGGKSMQHHQMGVVPEGLYGDYDQLGIVPEGLGHSSHHQMGGYHNQMGGYHNQMGIVPSGLGGVMDQWNALSTTHKVLVGAGVAVGGAFLLKQMGVIKSVPFLG